MGTPVYREFVRMYLDAQPALGSPVRRGRTLWHTRWQSGIIQSPLLDNGIALCTVSPRSGSNNLNFKHLISSRTRQRHGVIRLFCRRMPRRQFHHQ